MATVISVCTQRIAGNQTIAAALVPTQSEHSHPPAGGMLSYASAVLVLRCSDVPFQRAKFAHTLVPLLCPCDMEPQLASPHLMVTLFHIATSSTPPSSGWRTWA